MKYHDTAVTDSDLTDLLEELGWSTEFVGVERDFISETDWGKVKRKINSSNALTILESPSPELSSKAVKLDNLDAIISPERNRKDPGINHVIAKAAEENNTAIILQLKDILTTSKHRMHTLSHWRTTIKLYKKYGFNLIISTGAENKAQLRNPEDINSLLKTLDIDDSKPLSENPRKMLENI